MSRPRSGDRPWWGASLPESPVILPPLAMSSEHPNAEQPCPSPYDGESALEAMRRQLDRLVAQRDVSRANVTYYEQRLQADARSAKEYDQQIRAMRRAIESYIAAREAREQ